MRRVAVRSIAWLGIAIIALVEGAILAGISGQVILLSIATLPERQIKRQRRGRSPQWAWFHKG